MSEWYAQDYCKKCDKPADGYKIACPHCGALGPYFGLPVYVYVVRRVRLPRTKWWHYIWPQYELERKL